MQGTAMLKNLLRTSWRSLIVGAVADSHEFFSAEFLREMEQCSPFRFEFLRARRGRLASREGLFARYSMHFWRELRGIWICRSQR